MRILIAGAGSIGTVIGMKFSKAHEVILLRKKHLGIRIVEIFGEELFSRPMQILSAQELTGNFNIVFVTTQAQQTEKLCMQLKGSRAEFKGSNFYQYAKWCRKSRAN